MTPAGMVYNGKVLATGAGATLWSETECWPGYTGLFYPHLRATELGMRVESVLNIDAPQFDPHSPGPHTQR